MAKRSRRKFTPEFKADAVRLCAPGGKSPGEVARQFDLSESSVRKWVNQAEADASPTPTDLLTTAERTELSELRRRVKRLEMEREIPKKSGGLLREGERVRFAFVFEWKAHWPVAVICEVLDVSCSGYYAWKVRPEAARVRDDARLLVEIKAAQQTGKGTYGSPRVLRELRAKGRRVGKKRIERLMRDNDLAPRRKRRFRKTTDSNHSDPIAPNVLNRDFDVELPNVAWVTDVTYVWTLQGWLYLAAILDLFSRRVVGWSTSAHNDRALALDALKQALDVRRPAPGYVHHSDRGSVYASADYGHALAATGAVKSMSGKGDCWDNAVAESFFATIKGERLDHENYETRAEARAAIADFIDGFYNPVRRHSTIGYVSPIEFELSYQTKRLAA
ncbi:MAG: IS3 family transposase [Polyangiales bacterium]